MEIVKHRIATFIFIFNLLVPAAIAQEHPGRISMIKFIANPDVYVGKRVSMAGWFYGTSLWVTREHAEMHDQSSEVMIIVPDEAYPKLDPCEEQYVVITGIVIDNLSHYTIEDVTRVYGINEGVECLRIPFERNK